MFDPYSCPTFHDCLFHRANHKGRSKRGIWLSDFSMFDFSCRSCLSWSVFFLFPSSFFVCIFLSSAPFFYPSLDVHLQSFFSFTPLAVSLILSPVVSIEISPVDPLFVCIDWTQEDHWGSWAQHRGPPRAMYSLPWERGILTAKRSEAALSFSFSSLGTEQPRLMQWCHHRALWTLWPYLIYVAPKSHLILFLNLRNSRWVSWQQQGCSIKRFSNCCIIQPVCNLWYSSMDTAFLVCSFVWIFLQ